MQVTEILQVIKPYVLGWVETSGEEGGYAPSPHELDGAHHIGTLTSSQYPDALLRDGSRSLTGNLSVGAGITVDGVDLSAFKSDYDSHVLTANAHHNQVSLDANADAVLSLSIQQIGLDTQAANRVFAGPTRAGAAVPTFRALVAADIPALGGTPALTFTTSNAAGSASTYIRTDASLAIFDATAPTTILPDDAAAAGSAAFAARRDHKHAIATAAATTLTVASTNTEGAGNDFARATHTHAITTSSDPGAAAAILASTAAGLLTLMNLNLRASSNQIVLQSAGVTGTLTWTPASTNKTITLPNYTGTAALGAGTATVSSSNSVATDNHTHAITSSSNPGAAAAILASSASGYLQLVRLGLGVAPSVPLHVLATSEQARFCYDAGSYLTVTVADGSTTTIATAETGDIVLDPGGDDVLPAGSVGVDLGDYNRMWRTLYAAELYVETLVAQDVLATIGGRIIVAPTTQLIADCGSGDATIDVEHNNLASGDFVMLQTAPGGSAQVEVMKVTSGASGITGGYRYSVTRNQDGSGANAWLTGDAVVNLGSAAGEGFIELTSTSTIHSDLGPTMAIYARTAATNWDDVAPVLAAGNLSSFVDYGSDEFGFAVGNDLALTPTTGFQGITADRTDGIRLFNVGLEMYDGGDQRIDFDPTATGTDAMMWAGPSSSDKRFIITGDGDVWLSTLAISEQMGDMLFSLADGLALWGPGCAITPTSWTDTRGKTATLSGAFHQVAGPWAQTRALMVEPAATNLWTNPSVEINTTNFVAEGVGTTIARVTSTALFGIASLETTTVSAGSFGVRTDSITVSDSTAYTASVYVKGTPGLTLAILLNERDSSDVTIASTTETVVATGQWQRVVVSRTMGATGVKARIYIRTTVAAGVFYADGFQIEQSAFATSYLDGSLGTGYTWNGDGTPHANTSTRAATVVNLDAHAPMLNDLSTVSHSIWVQAQYDADAANWPSGANSGRIVDCRGADNDNRIIITFDPNISDSFRVYLNGDYRISVATQTFEAGDWLHIAVTLDYANDLYYLYLNGVSIGSATTTLTAPTGLVDWILGTIYAGSSGYYGGWVFGEYAVFNRVLTAEEVTSIYARNQPLADAGALRRGGLYILDGEFSLSSGNGGPRVQIDVNGVAGYSGATTQTFSLQTDGDLFMGSNISAAGTTGFAFFATAQTYNSELMGAGDVLLGDNSAGKINLLWDVSEGDVVLRRGNGAGSGRITLDGSADSILIGQAAASQNNVLISSGVISIRNNVTERIGITAAGILTIKDSSGNAVLTFDASAGAEITKKLSMLGADSAIAIGVAGTIPTSASAGTGIWIDRTGIYGLSSGTYQAKMQATDGKVVAGAGGVSMDANGFNVLSDTGYTAGKAINFYDGATRVGEIYLRALGDPLYTNWMEISTQAIASKNSQIRVKANAPASYAGQISLEVEVASGLSPYVRLSSGASYEMLETNSVLVMKNSTAAPSASVTDSILLYAVDVSSSSELRVRDEAGNVTTLSPHNFSLIPAGPSEPLAWAYYGLRGGMAINVDMLRLARLVERLSGEQLVYIRENLN